MPISNSTDCCTGSNLPCPETTPTEPPAPTTPPCTPYEYTCGDWRMKYDANGCVTRERVANNMPNGTYINPTIVVNDGCIVSITSGSRVLQSRPEPCTTQTPGTTPSNTVGLDPSICNQLSGTPAALLANCQVASGTNIGVTGCGTLLNPYVINYTGPGPTAPYAPTFVNGVAVQTPLISPVTQVSSTTLTVTAASGISTVNTVGATASGGGIQISNGLVKTWVNPVTTITATAPIVATTTGTSVVLSIDPTTDILKEKIIAGISCGNTFIDPATGTLPMHGHWHSATLRVYGTRVFTGLSFALTIYDSTGAVLGTGTDFIPTASAAAALSLVDGAYTFSGTGAC